MQTLYEQCFELTRGDFQIDAYPTDVLSHHGQKPLPGLFVPTKAPAQALTYEASIIRYALWRRSEDNGIEAKKQPFKRISEGIVVRREDALQGLVLLLRQAVVSLNIARQRATADGLHA